MSETNNNPNKLNTRTKVAAGVAAFVGGLAFLHGTHHETSEPQPTSTYTVQPGETLSGIAEEVAQNTPEHETMQEAAENIRDTNELGQAPQLGNGQEIQVPASADVNPSEAGVQLTELPQPQEVVPDESGFNPNTPR
jgi:hypothetical protein